MLLIIQIVLDVLLYNIMIVQMFNKCSNVVIFMSRCAHRLTRHIAVVTSAFCTSVTNSAATNADVVSGRALFSPGIQASSEHRRPHWAEFATDNTSSPSLIPSPGTATVTIYSVSRSSALYVLFCPKPMFTVI